MKNVFGKRQGYYDELNLINSKIENINLVLTVACLGVFEERGEDTNHVDIIRIDDVEDTIFCYDPVNNKRYQTRKETVQNWLDKNSMCRNES
jgi:hypothetical protein